MTKVFAPLLTSLVVLVSLSSQVDTELLPVRAFLTYTIPCTDSDIARTKAAALKLLQHVQCMTENKCKVVEMRHACLSPDKVKVEAVFLAEEYEAKQSVHTFIAEYFDKTSNTHHRVRRGDFDDIEPDEGTSRTCDVGSALINNGCVACTAGTQEASESCRECAVGEYQDQTGQTSCAACTSPKTTLSTGSNSAADCVVACPIPSTTTNSYYANNGKELTDGANVAAGTPVTLTCSNHYTYKNAASGTETCTDADTNLPNECFKVGVSPTTAGYALAGTSLSVTCTVDSTVEPTSLAWFRDNAAVESGSGTLTSESYISHKATYVYAVTVTGVYSCGVQISGNYEMTSDTAAFTFVSTEMSPDRSVVEGAAATITAKATYVAELKNTLITWSKDGKVITTDVTTSADSSFFHSALSIASVSAEIAGTYTATVSFIDLSYTEKLRKVESMSVTVCRWITEYGACYQHADECKKRVNVYCSCNRDPTKCSGAADIKEEYCDKSECEMSGGAVSKRLAGITLYFMSFVMFCV